MFASALDLISFSAAILLAIFVLWDKQPSFARGTFAAGMLVLAAQTLLQILADRSPPDTVLQWQTWRLTVVAFAPGVWLLFSLSYARGHYREFLMRGRMILILAFVLPVFFAAVFHNQLLISVLPREANRHPMLRLGTPGFLLELVFLLSAILVLLNLERTYRASVGTMRWRIKFMILGVGLIFIVFAYSCSQSLLYHAIDLTLQTLDSGALLLGGVLISRSLRRVGHFEVDVYPSHAVLRDSFIILFAGIYLLIVGVFAKVVAFLGGDASFTLKTFVVLIGLVLMTLVFLSDRVRLRTRRFVSRHFQRPFYDYRTVWRNFTQATARRVEKGELCSEIVKLVSEIFQALSVTVWLVNDGKGKLSLAASTSLSVGDIAKPEFELDEAETANAIAAFRARSEPIDIDASAENWVVALRKIQPDEFHKGGNRICVPIISGGETLGVIMLGDRVSGLPFSVQDLDLLKSISDQLAANLLNMELSQRLTEAKQLEAFQAMSAFFVHDLKNTASTLSMMLHNLPTHFNDPRFREDALRGVSKTVTHINELIRRLSLLREELTIRPVEGDLNISVLDALKSLEPTRNLDVVKKLGTLPKIRLDTAHIQNVVVNLVINARDALSAGGEIRIETNLQNGWVVLAVADNGCGMKPEFIQNSLFRPFQTTKKQGLGIGMFQCKMIVEAHHGKIEVQSELAKGTTFRIFLPVPI